MVDEISAFFPDTNFFLECRDPIECPWGQVTASSEIRLVVCRQVRSEIDSLKASGRGRKSDRARSWSSKLRQASRAGGSLLLRQANPKVTLIIPSVTLPLDPLPIYLTRTRPDDIVIADILAICRDNIEMSDGVFFTDDGGAADTANAVGLRSVDIPFDQPNAKDGWRLPGELDNADRTVLKLQQEIALLKNSNPNISAICTDFQGAHVEKLEFFVTDFKALSPSEVDHFVQAAIQLNPPKDNFHQIPARPEFDGRFSGPQLPLTWNSPSQQAVKIYREQLYPDWASQLSLFFQNLHTELTHPNRSKIIFLQLANIGVVPASAVKLTVEAVGSIRVRDIPDAPVEYSLPKAPIAPEGSWVSRLIHSSFAAVTPRSFASAVPLQSARPRMDQPDRFVWNEKSDRRWIGLCEEFRHQEAAQTLPMLIEVESPNGDISGKGALKITVAARNLPKPLLTTMSVEFTVEEGDTPAYATHFLHLHQPWNISVGQERLPKHPADLART